MLKKIISIFFVTLLSFFIVSCSDKPEQNLIEDVLIKRYGDMYDIKATSIKEVSRKKISDFGSNGEQIDYEGSIDVALKENCFTDEEEPLKQLKKSLRCSPESKMENVKKFSKDIYERYMRRPPIVKGTILKFTQIQISCYTNRNEKPATWKCK